MDAAHHPALTLETLRRAEPAPGAAELRMARLFAAYGEPDHALHLLRDALTLDPRHALTLDTIPAFHPLAKTPTYRRLVRKALHQGGLL